MTDTGISSVSASPAESSRLSSIDALRGFDMFWLLGAQSLLKALDNLGDNPFTRLLTTQLNHVKWEGFHFYDLIFPLFLFIVGVSIVFSLNKAFQANGSAAVLWRVLRRGVFLFLLGILYYGGLSEPWPNIRLAGVLHRIAACYVLASVAYVLLKSPKYLWLVCTAVLIGYWALLTFVPIPDLPLNKTSVEETAAKVGSDSPWEIAAATEGRVLGLYEEGRNLTNFVDFLCLPGEKANVYYINEGLLSTFPATVLCLFGVLAALLLKDESMAPRAKVVRLLAYGAIAIVVGLLWSIQFPIIKRIWTSSFILVSGGLSAWMLAVFYYLVDVKQWRAWCQPFVWIGCNALTLYIAVRIVPFDTIATSFVGGDVANFFNRHVCDGFGSVVIAFVSLLLVLLLARFLYRREIFIRV